MKTIIQAGKTRDISEVSWLNSTWLILDIGFAKTGRKTCGLLIHSPKQKECKTTMNFNEAVEAVIYVAKTNKKLNLVIEAPLSVAFDENSNPTPRWSIAVDKHGKPTPVWFEKQDGKTRYWYYGLACGLIVATLYLMRRLLSKNPNSEIKLFEGFVSFNPKSGKPKKQNSHLKDVKALRDVIRRVITDRKEFERCIHDPASPGINSSYRVESVFKVAGKNFDFGVPLVIKPVVKRDG